jgi:hypothetical protein
MKFHQRWLICFLVGFVAYLLIASCFSRSLFGPTDAPITYPGVDPNTPIPDWVPSENDSPALTRGRMTDGGRD